MDYVGHKALEGYKAHFRNIYRGRERVSTAEIVDALTHFPLYLIVSANGQMKAEGVAVSPDGSFVAVKMEAGERVTTSVADGNFNNGDKEGFCDMLETARAEYLEERSTGALAA